MKRRTRTDGLPPPTPSEAAFEALLARFRAAPALAIVAAPAPVVEPSDQLEPSEAQTFVAGLFARAREFALRDPYATIGDAESFNTKIVGISFEGRQDVAAGVQPGIEVALVRQPQNEYDPHAIAVLYGTLQLGFIRKPIAARIAPHIDGGARYRAEVRHVTGGGRKAVGINLWVWRERSPAERRTAAERARGDAVLGALIGEHPLRPAQRAVLERIDARKNTLAVLGTGRGKSLCFQLPAAVGALERGTKTVVLYPLRALANDQYEGLVRRLEPLGLRIFRANGAIDGGERAALMAALADGAWDVICATPEFVHYHAERFGHERSRPQLVVVDEAHHVVESTHRPAYGRLGGLLHALGDPQVLALTATAGDDVFAGIRRGLGIEAWVIDPTVRANLSVVDARNTTNKAAYIAREVDADGKAIVYCNSRAEATKVAERLRAQLGAVVAFYHAGVGAAERAQVERFFRSGDLRVVVATSAFGEGIDLPDVRDVFLYHLNFDLTEFNQQSGRAGRDEAPARIHLLFGEKDRALNEFILERDAPTLATLRAIYRGVRALARDGVVRATPADLAELLDLGDKVAAGTVGAAFGIFAETGLVEAGEDEEGRYVRLQTVDEKVDLTRSERFAEGEAAREDFRRFCELALSAAPDVLAAVINRPIYPSNVALER